MTLFLLAIAWWCLIILVVVGVLLVGERALARSRARRFGRAERVVSASLYSTRGRGVQGVVRECPVRERAR